MFRHRKHFGTTFRYPNFLCIFLKNCIKVFAETKFFFWKNYYRCIIFIDVFIPCDCHLSNIIRKSCDIVSNASFCTFTYHEALCSMVADFTRTLLISSSHSTGLFDQNYMMVCPYFKLHIVKSVCILSSILFTIKTVGRKFGYGG